MFDMIVESILDLVGNTPMVRINHLNSNSDLEMYVKLEMFNPGGSVKDRIGKYMIEYAERDGVLTKDKIVIEPTSGNTGIALAITCAVKGYRLVLVMPETMTAERRKILTIHGAEIVLSPGSKGMDGAEDLARDMVRKDPGKYFMPNQFANKYNVLAHYETTAEEIWRDTDGRITHFVAGIGTSGTIMGVSKSLKARNPNIKIIAVEPDTKTPIQGLKNLDTQYVPEIFDKSAIDEKHHVKLDEYSIEASGEEAYLGCLALAVDRYTILLPSHLHIPPHPCNLDSCHCPIVYRCSNSLRSLLRGSDRGKTCGSVGFKNKLSGKEIDVRTFQQE